MWVWDTHALHSKLQDSQGYRVGPCLKNKNKVKIKTKLAIWYFCCCSCTFQMCVLCVPYGWGFPEQWMRGYSWQFYHSCYLYCFYFLESVIIWEFSLTCFSLRILSFFFWCLICISFKTSKNCVFKLQCCTLNVLSLYGNWIIGHNIMIMELLSECRHWHMPCPGNSQVSPLD